MLYCCVLISTVCMELMIVLCGRICVIPRLMMCKTVQATPQAGHSMVLESSSSSQGASGLNGAARREMGVSGSTVGKKVADSNELERLFTQPNIQDTCMVSPHHDKLNVCLVLTAFRCRIWLHTLKDNRTKSYLRSFFNCNVIITDGSHGYHGQ